MTAPFLPRTPGSPLKVYAAEFNAMLRAALAEQARMFQIGAGIAPTRPTVFLVRNDSGADLPRHGILGISAPIFLPSEQIAEESFDQQVAFVGVAPVADDHIGKWVMAVEPIPNGAIGRCIAQGVTQTTLTVNAATDQYAEMVEGSQYLETCAAGSARILWKETLPASHRRAIILIQPQMPTTTMFAVRVTQTGGSAGSASTACTYTYTVTDAYGATILTGASPVKRRPAAGPFVAPPAASWGVAFRDTDGTVILWDANEVPDVQVCP